MERERREDEGERQKSRGNRHRHTGWMMDASCEKETAGGREKKEEL